MENLILLHGALGSKSQFKELIKLLEPNFNVFAFDLEGHGKNEGEKEFSMMNFSQNVLDFMDDNQIGTSHFFGYSMGGYIALYMANEYPEKFGKIICLGTKLEWDPEIAKKEIRSLNVEKIKEKVPHFADELEKRHRDWRAVVNKTAKMMIGLGDGKGVLTENYSKIQHQVLLCLGEDDKMVSVDETRNTANLLPNGQWEILGNTPHPIEKIDKEKLSLLLENFISSNSKGWNEKN